VNVAFKVKFSSQCLTGIIQHVENWNYSDGIVNYTLSSIFVPNLRFFCLTIPEILGGGGFQHSKSGSRDPQITTFDLTLHFFVTTQSHPSLCQI